MKKDKGWIWLTIALVAFVSMVVTFCCISYAEPTPADVSDQYIYYSLKIGGQK